MTLSIGPLLSELSASSDVSPVARLLPFILLALIVLAGVAIFLGRRGSGKKENDDWDDWDDWDEGT